MCSSFTKTNLVKIQQYEASKFRKDVMARNPTFLIDAPEVIYLPHGSLCYQVLKHEVQEGEQSWAMLESFYNQLDPDTIASVQLLMAVHAASSETVRLSCQKLIKELVDGKKMKVSNLVKKLTVIAKFNEADDHLNAHAQRNGGGSRKKQLDSIVSVKQFTNKTQKPRNAIDAALILCLTKQNTNGVTIVICQRFQAAGTI